MKKLLQFLFILFLGVVSCACVNIFAVHELNEIASEYLDEGDVKSAVSRLEASIDLDGTIYESRYNLASAYIQLGECEKAIEQAKFAIDLSKKEPAAYYTHAVALQCSADNLFKTEDDTELNGALLEKANKKYVEYMTEANESYKKYVDLAPHAEDFTQVVALIKENEEKLSNLKNNPSVVY